MRVLMISKACIVGIYQRQLEALARQGVTLRVIVPPSWRDERGEQPLERLHTTGYEMAVCPIVFNGRFHWYFYRGLGAHFRAFRPDIVHIDEEPYNLAAWQLLWHARRVGARALFFSWQNIARQYPPPFRWGEQWVLRHARHAIVGTDDAVTVWRGKGYAGPLAVIPQFGTDVERFQPRPRPDRPFTVGYIGRLVPEKGVDDLLAALAMVPGDWRAQIVGGGPQLAVLQAQAGQLGLADRIHFTGQVASAAMPGHYGQLDALVLPSRTRPNWKEQFGRVLVEAMACGVPVVASASGAIPGVVGAAGLLFPEGDRAALAAHLATLATSPARRAELAELGRARVLGQFTHEQVAQATAAVYRDLLATRD